MVAGKVKVTVGLQRSAANTKTDASPKSTLPSPSSGKVTQKGAGAVFSRSFGVYFPRSSAQVQPRPPDVVELIRQVEELRERESRLKTELLEHKLLRESVSIVPVLENEISWKDAEIERNAKKIDCLETENERLRQDLEVLHIKAMEEKQANEQKAKVMQAEIMVLKKAVVELSRLESSKRLQNNDDSQRFQGLIDVSVKSNLIRNLKKGLKLHDQIDEKKSIIAVERQQPCNEIAETSEPLVRRPRLPRVPKPPPRPLSTPSSSCSIIIDAEKSSTEHKASTQPPPPPPPPRVTPPTRAAPPPPPPPHMVVKPGCEKVRRMPEVVELYHSLMRRDTRRESGAGGAPEAAASSARDMIGEIENRSTHLLAIKTDVETQGDFIRFLIKEVEDASFTDIQDVVPFVKWLDDELSYLIDERAVLKHFNWPEQKADALREAAFGYSDLKKLESEASSFRDNPRQPCSSALKKMQSLLEKLEHGVYNLSRMRESATKRYNLLHIPTNWMLDTGFVVQIKLASVKLAMKYMKRVSAELESNSSISGSCVEEEELIVQGVRFAFRVHQFAGGFDAETMRAFQELRDKARSCHVQRQNQQNQRYLCRTTTC
ncbi:protein CHUP1, chloroplastic-like [Impatiens glandulifera]|uniref:protein CHUP1, chloroplastic-like n=1 Tax=Impatiens glandulifera TaxID=253017 RepID=UPI001FB198D7|nr:protein CHUP1, chloroplastic-like [Impatiens glandulifera]